MSKILCPKDHVQKTMSKRLCPRDQVQESRSDGRMQRGMGMIATVALEEVMGKIRVPWSPVEIAAVNDQVIRVALLDGESLWI
jgi:hypothetical protein